MSGWSARVTGGFEAKVKAATREEAQGKVETAVTSHGGMPPYEPDVDRKTGGQTIAYA